MNTLRYMIKNKEGLYSKGGYSPTVFVEQKIGKIWNSIGALKNHLNLVMEHGGIPHDWEVVGVDIVLTPYGKAKQLYEEQYLLRKEKEKVDDSKRRKEYLIEQKQKIEEELNQL